MKLSSYNNRIRCEFDSFCKTVLRNEARDVYKEKERRYKRESFFSEMSEQELEQLSYTDEYASDYLSFDVREYTVSVRNSALAEAIAALSDDKREIILLSYFLDMNDREIGEQLNLLRSNVQYKRTNSLRELKELIERGLKDEYK